MLSGSLSLTFGNPFCCLAGKVTNETSENRLGTLGKGAVMAAECGTAHPEAAGGILQTARGVKERLG